MSNILLTVSLISLASAYTVVNTNGNNVVTYGSGVTTINGVTYINQCPTCCSVVNNKVYVGNDYSRDLTADDRAALDEYNREMAEWGNSLGQSINDQVMTELAQSMPWAGIQAPANPAQQLPEPQFPQSICHK